MPKSRTVFWVTAAILPIVILAAMWTLVVSPPRWILRVVATHNPGVLFYIDTNAQAIALTIDDSPHPDVTPGILEVLERHGARATFFVIGSHAAKHPDLVEAIRAGGHELGNHLYMDRRSSSLSAKEFRERLRQTDELIRPEGPVKWCRPGSGSITRRMVKIMLDEGYQPCLASQYPLDIHLPPSIARRHFMASVRPGAILVLHDGYSTRRKTIDVLEDVLPRVVKRGYRVVTVSELAGITSPTR
ncbi:MAG: polysaccharide deacetylase family protein [Candidatus Latescibacterota bacterium]|nr:MAG: polysaccharide deacetylase family protein [Candidatus Latescibacterota bacterium]